MRYIQRKDSKAFPLINVMLQLLPPEICLFNMQSLGFRHSWKTLSYARWCFPALFNTSVVCCNGQRTLVYTFLMKPAVGRLEAFRSNFAIDDEALPLQIYIEEKEKRSRNIILREAIYPRALFP